jgi:RHS repeat-associated protein
MEGAGGIGGLLARSSGYSSGNWTTHNFYFADGNGNITYMLDGGQVMVANYRYDPFGNTISSSGTLASSNVYRFSSKEIHANSGMYYYGFRFYDPNLQRWINMDPLGDYVFLRAYIQRTESVTKHAIQSESVGNLYSFVHNDPVYLIDPLGLGCMSDCLKSQIPCKSTLVAAVGALGLISADFPPFGPGGTAPLAYQAGFYLTGYAVARGINSGLIGYEAGSTVTAAAAVGALDLAAISGGAAIGLPLGAFLTCMTRCYGASGLAYDGPPVININAPPPVATSGPIRNY